MKKLFSLIAILFISILSQAQNITMTAYEQARHDLASKTIAKLTHIAARPSLEKYFA